MVNLAIRGHSTRGKEVIEILEMLGGENIHNYGGTFNECYAIDNNKIYTIYTSVAEIDNHAIFTLEQFEEKFPYKIGDKVCYQPNTHIYTICISEIISMKWADNSVIYFTSNGHSLHACDLQPYKEETMEDKGTLVQIDLTRELRIADEVEVILGDYEFVLKDGKTYFVKKKPQYPKTYKECCDVLGLNTMANDAQGYKADLIIRFQELIIARDAYWKIAGEEMGLDKSWKPDWKDDSETYYTISYKGINIKCYNNTDVYSKLAFPTEEMRDAFYDNFKDLIESCKELL